MSKIKRKPYNSLVPQLQEAITALNRSEQLFQDSLAVNFGTTIKHREQRHISVDIKNGALLRLLEAIRGEFNV